MNTTRRSLFAALGLLALAGGPAAAEETPPPSPAEIAAWVAQLGDDDFTVREAAEEALAGAGFAAFDLLFEAVHDPDLEIASRAEYLLRRLRVVWIAADDSPAVRRMLEDYEELEPHERLQRIVFLSRLPEEEGVRALCRLVRFERATQLSKRAALAVLELPLETPEAERRWEIVRATLESSPRPAAAWLRCAALGAGDPSGAAAEWDRLIAAEFGVWEQYPDETQPEILTALLRRQIDAWRRAGQTERALAAMRQIVQLEPGHNESLRVLLDWLIAQEAWPVVDEVAARFGGRIEQDPLLMYVVAWAHERQGKSDQATALVGRAQALAPEDQRYHLETAYHLQERGWIEWSVAEYRRGIAIGPANNNFTLAAQMALAELLHDQERHVEAAGVLETAVATMRENSRSGNQALNADRDPEEVAARRFYFLACDALARGDLAEQRARLDEGLAESPLDTEILIALYRQSGGDAPLREKVVARVREAVTSYRALIAEYPDDASAYNQLAWLVANTEGDLDEALRASERSLELLIGGRRGGYLDTLARCYFARGELAQALKYQSQAARLEPHQRQIARQLAEFQRAAAAAGLPVGPNETEPARISSPAPPSEAAP